MFERFTDGARRVVTAARAHTVGGERVPVTEEHILRALLDQRGTRAAAVLDALGANGGRASIEEGLAEARRRGGLSKAEADALADIGIDVGEIVAKVEEAHGEGAMGPGVRSPRGSAARRTFSEGARRTIEQALRVSRGRGDRFVGDEHLLLALTVRPGVVAEVLADHGVTFESVTRALPGEEAGAA